MLSSAASCLWKSFRRSRTPFRDRPETVRLHPGSSVHLHPGILFEIIPEHRSESYRNRVHLAPDSPGKWHIPDAEDSDTVNHLDWYEATGFTRPYPGEKKVRPASDFKKAVPTKDDDDKADD